jgi:hypothetical protein
MEITEQAKKYFQEFIEDDYTQLGFLTEFISDNAPDLATNSLAKITKTIIKQLVEENGVYVVNEKTESKMEMSIEQIMAEIDSVFAETNGNPRIGDGIWFGVD